MLEEKKRGGRDVQENHICRRDVDGTLPETRLKKTERAKPPKQCPKPAEVATIEDSGFHPEKEAFCRFARPPGPTRDKLTQPSTPPPPCFKVMESSSTLNSTATNALTLNWSFGFNKDVVDGVHSLCSDGRQALFYVAAHTGVIYDYTKRTQELLQVLWRPKAVVNFVTTYIVVHWHTSFGSSSFSLTQHDGSQAPIHRVESIDRMMMDTADSVVKNPLV